MVVAGTSRLNSARVYFARPKLTHLTLSHTNPKHKQGCELRPRLHFGLVSVTAA